MEPLPQGGARCAGQWLGHPEAAGASHGSGHVHGDGSLHLPSRSRGELHRGRAGAWEGAEEWLHGVLGERSQDRHHGHCIRMAIASEASETLDAADCRAVSRRMSHSTITHERYYEANVGASDAARAHQLVRETGQEEGRDSTLYTT